MPITIFSLKKSREKVIHDEARELLRHTVYVPYLFSWGILGAHLRILFTRPVHYFQGLFDMILGNLKSPQFLIRNLAFFPKAVYLADWIGKQGITHLHAYWATYPASVAMIASRISGVPFSFTGHAHDIYLDTTHLKKKIKRAAFVTTCTRQNKDYLEKLAPGCPEEKILLNYHGLDLELFETNGKQSNKVVEILSVGTLQYHKGFEYFVNGLALLKERGVLFHATIVGGGPLEADIRKHLRLLDLEENVTMTGGLKQSEVIPYYKKADVVVLMAQAEWHWGIPNVLIEGLASKAAIITTRFGSVEELIQHEETGLLVPAKDPKAFADAAERLSRDTSLCRRLAQKGHERVVRYFDLRQNVEVLRGRLVS